MENHKAYCPFCVTSTICDGPHIETIGEQVNLFKYLYHAKQDHIFNAIDEVRKYGLENNIDLQKLSERIKERVNKRDR